MKDDQGQPYSQREDETQDEFVQRIVYDLHTRGGYRIAAARPTELADAPPSLGALTVLAATDSRLIYFAQCQTKNGPIKVGIATDVARRLGEVQTGCPYPIELVGTLPGGRAGEKLFHRLFADYRSHGEWFWSDRVVMRTIRTLLREQKQAAKRAA